jgi:DNA polymerase I
MKLFLLDGHALVYRAHYAFITRPLLNSKGWNVSAVNGFTRSLLDLLNNQKPTHLAVAFDPQGPTFRHVKYEEYKANRDAQPEDISFAIPWIIKILEAMRIPIITIPGFEADDVIGTLAKQAEVEGFDVFMVTPDKDYGQLVSDKVFMYKPSRSGNEVEIWGAKEVCENWGIKRVDQVVDMLALVGDSVDNIPGIKGIGPKGAEKLLAEFDSVENMLANADKIPGSTGEKVRAGAESATLSKWLARIDTEVPIQFDAASYAMEQFDGETLQDLFKELEFRTLAAQVLNSKYGGGSGIVETNTSVAKSGKVPLAPRAGSVQQPSLFGDDPAAQPVQEPLRLGELNIHNTPHEYHLVQSDGEITLLLAALEAVDGFAYDSETTSLSTHDAEIVGLSFAVKPHEAWYVPISEKRSEANQQLERFRAILEHPTKLKIGQNLKYDAAVLLNYGIHLGGPIFDTMIAHYLLEPDQRHGMNYLAESLLNYSPVKIEDLIGPKGKGQGTMRDVPIEKIKDYAAEDADVTLRLKEYLEPKLKAEQLEKLFYEIETPLVKVLTEMEYEGVRIDVPYLNAYSVVLGKEIGELEEKIIDSAGQAFNIGSPKQVGEMLFDTLKIPYPGKKLKSGQYSTDEDVLSTLKEHPICKLILEHRGLSKLKSTYVDALPLMVNKKTGRVHSSFNQALAATGRLSSNHPNLQNIPIRTADGRKVREAFIPRDEEHLFLSADYSQIELRLIAEISKDEAMLDAFQKNLDIHTATAAGVYGVPLEEVTSDQRRAAKTVNFSIIYGAGATNLSNQLGLKRADAKELIENYFKRYSGLSTYMTEIVEFARKNGYVETLMGRRRYLRDIESRNSLARSFAERIAVNTPIQGSAADLIKMAMININRELKAQKLRTRMILQVHDELIFDVYAPELDVVRPLILDLMSNAMPGLQVPILVEAGVGKNWLEAH